MKFLLVLGLLLSSQALSSHNDFLFFQQNLPVEFFEEIDGHTNSYQEDMKVTLAVEDSRFILSVGDVWLFYGEIVKKKNGVIFYDLRREIGNGQCHYDDERKGCTLGLKWNTRSDTSDTSDKGHILINTSDTERDNALDIKFSITRYWSSDSQKVRVVGRIEKLISASEVCNFPPVTSSDADLYAWIEYCSSLAPSLLE